MHGLRVIFALVTLLMAASLRAEDRRSGNGLNVEQLRDLCRNGAFAPVIAHAPRLITMAKKRGDDAEAAELLLSLAGAQQALGRVGEAAATLEDALARARAAGDPSLQCATLAAAGANLALSRHWEGAERALGESTRLAESLDDARLHATVLIKRAGLHLSRGQMAQAQAAFEAAGARTKSSNAPAVWAEAASGAALAACLAERTEAVESTSRADALVAVLPPEYLKASLLLRVGRCYQRLAAKPAHAALRTDAWRAFQEAAELGRSLGSASIEGHALANTAELYEADDRREEALILARRAASLAQRRQMLDVQYRWEWQVGRLLRHEGRADAAIDAYRNAAIALNAVRADVAIGHGNFVAPDGVANGWGFRQSVGNMFMEMADLLLMRAADPARAPEAVNGDLRAARDAMETLKAAELEDYFRSECATLAAGNVASVDEAVDPGTAVIYIIPLPDRTEILTSLTGGRLVRVRVDVHRAVLQREVGRLRRQLEDETTYNYQQTGKRIYEWLIAPLQPMLDAEQIDTLVFVPDEALRTVPTAALWDGERFLVERYATAIVPALTLTRAQQVRRPRVLAAGVARAQGDFPALPAVREELAHLKTTYDADVLMDQELTYARLQQALDAKPFNVVHIASHGEFLPDASETFLMLHGERLGLDDLSRLVQPKQYRGAPVQLLTLSACQTASGADDNGARAALGLGGVALKAGARSALATLWYVNDQVSSDLIRDFYKHLGAAPARGRAQALRSAQLTFIHRHPCYWSPYLMIGAWQ